MEMGLIHAGDKIDMTLIKDYSGKAVKVNKKYTSQLLELVSNRILKIAMPIDKGKIIPLGVGEEYHLCFFTKNGLYRCRAQIKSRFKEGKIFVLLVVLLSDFEKYQRRNYFRIDYVADVKVRIITSEEKMYEKLMIKDDFNGIDEKAECYEKLHKLRTDWNKATLIDLSGGGARIQTKTPFKQNDEIKISIPIFDNTVKQYTARVIASSRIQNETTTYENRLEFIDISSSDRDFLVKCIFEEQRRRVKK